MKRSVLTTSFLLLVGILMAQVTSYPYTEDFESFPVNNVFTSPYFEPNPFPNSWTNEQAGDPPQDWYGRSVPTASAGTGPSGDHTTGAGVYIYVEDNAPNDHDSVILITPQFDLTGLVNPTFRYWVHSNHAGAGTPVSEVNHMLLEINAGMGWMQLDSVGHEGDLWLERIVSLVGFPAVVQLRFVVNNNNGAATHDIAIDDVRLEDPPAFDLAVLSAGVLPVGYQQIPASQQFSFFGDVQNMGGSGLTNVQLKVEVGSYADSTSIASLASGEDSTLDVGNFVPGQAGSYTAFFTGSATENDTLPANDTTSLSFAVSDSVLARDDSTFIGGIGFTGASGSFGQAFTLTESDTLTSISLFLNLPTAGDSFRVLLYSFNGTPLQRLDSTALVEVQPGQVWYDIPLLCPRVLAPGEYFITADQPSLNNLSVGYTDQIYTPGITWFTTDFITWTSFESVPFEVTLLIRMNFGQSPGVHLAIDNGPLCTGDSVIVLANGSANYQWGGQPLGDSAVFFPNGDTTIIVSATSLNGCASVDTLDVSFAPIPDPALPVAVELCPGETVQVTASGGGGYLWSTGDTTATIDVDMNTGSPLTVQVSSPDGCDALSSTTVSVFPTPDPGLGDTTELLCFGESATLTASNGASYLWSNGESSASITVSPTVGTSYRVDVVSADGCAGSDSTFVPVNPELMGTADASPTVAGFANGQAWVVLSGGTPPYQFAWQDPNAQTDSVAIGLDAGNYSVTVTDAAGCARLFTVVVGSVTSLSEWQSSGWRIYPNPAHDHLWLETNGEFLTGDWSISLLDAQGKQVWQQGPAASSLSDRISLELPQGLVPGMYWLQIQTPDRQLGTSLRIE